jgi:hypothetical protein
MDVHEAARLIAKWWIEAPGYWRDPDMPPDIAWIAGMSFIESCYREARTPWLQAVIEAHTRAAVEAAEARIVAWTEAEAAEFLKSPKDSLEFFHGESLLELARCYRDGEHRCSPKEGVMKWNEPATTGDMWVLPLAIAAAFLIGALFA